MQIKIKPNSFFVFDLDDTLFPEIDFLRSGFRSIAGKLKPLTGTDIYDEMWRRYQKGENVFGWIISQYYTSIPHITIDWLSKEYREHMPDISLNKDAARFLNHLTLLSIPAGLITDGRSLTQRNKLKALNLENYFSDIIISEEFGSEKPDERNYRYFQDKYPDGDFYFFGDNTAKDFIAPAGLGWFTVCLKNKGSHIHTQTFSCQSYPALVITSFDEIQLVL